MIPRVPARGEAEFKTLRGQPLAQTGRFQQRPAPELVFVFEGRPRRGERDHFHTRPETGLQIERVGFAQQCDVKPFRHRAQKWRGDDEIPQSPQFNDEQFWFQSWSQG